MLIDNKSDNNSSQFKTESSKNNPILMCIPKLETSIKNITLTSVNMDQILTSTHRGWFLAKLTIIKLNTFKNNLKLLSLKL